MVVKARRCSRQDTEERKEPTVILVAWCMIWQIAVAVADVSFWGMCFTTQMVKLAAAIYVQKRENNSSLLHVDHQNTHEIIITEYISGVFRRSPRGVCRNAGGMDSWVDRTRSHYWR